MRITHEFNDGIALIRVEGLQRTTRVLHVADVHIGFIDSRDAAFVDVHRDLATRFQERHENRDVHGRIFPQEEAFGHILEAARRHEVDLLALGGDIVDFPALAGIEHVRGRVDECGIPALSTVGNHDWLFLGQEPVPEVRQACSERMDMLHCAPDFDRREVGDMVFVAVDNSDYQINGEQLHSVRQALAEKRPTVLMIHVPLSLPTLRWPTLNEWKGQPVLMADADWPAEERQAYGAGNEDTPETLEFVRMMCQSESLVAVLAGHLHHAHVDALNSWSAQYVAPAGYAGEYRLLEFRSL